MNDTATDATTIATLGSGPDLAISLSHGGNFTVGQIGAQYTVSIANVGSSSTTSGVYAQDLLPAGFTATAISGAGWTCNLTRIACSRSR